MNKKGFTLVELLAVIAILALLVIVALPNVLSMFNKAKKDTFLTEAKTVYKEVSKKYISESMRGNKVRNISNSNNKLDLESNDLVYNVKLDSKGNIRSFQVSNDTYCLSGKFNSLGELTADKITEGECEHIILDPENFTTDSWETIVEAVRDENTDKYRIGDTKEIDLGDLGIHNIRIANKSTPSECSNENFSQTACGFVLEFENSIVKRSMKSTNQDRGGWPASGLYYYVNNTLYNKLPSDLKNIIIDTKVVSGYGKNETENFVSTDKLYLLSTSEIWENGFSGDKAKDLTRQLDYYKEKGVTNKNYSAVIKKLDNSNESWWLRPAFSSAYGFYLANKTGNYSFCQANCAVGISPAFRIG